MAANTSSIRSGDSTVSSKNYSSDSSRSTPRLTVEAVLNLLNDKVNYVPMAVDHEDFENSSLKLLKLVFPEWFTSGSAKHLKLAQCTDGITNKLMKCKNLETGHVVLVRAYGKKSELIIDRQAELITFAVFQEDGLAPPLHCRFENGFVYGYVPGIPLKPIQLSSAAYYPLIARKIALWHQVDSVPGDKSPRLFKTLKKWLKNVPPAYTRPEIQAKFIQSIDMAYLAKELQSLEVRAKQLNAPVVFCHNDLLAANIIYNPDSKDVTFIDYEYGSFNFRSFDLANHFCEFAGFDCDYSLYPSEEFQRAWIREYLLHYDGQADESQVQKVVAEVAVFNIAAHFFWGLWALVQAHVSDIPFDYMSYAVLRFKELKRRLALLPPPM